MKRVILSLLLPLALASDVVAQRPPDTVFLEDLTWVEVRDLIAAGKTSIIIGTAGTEQNGPHMVLGKHRYLMEFAANRIARELGNVLVAPVVTYVPEGSWERPGGHMAKAGTITLPEERFRELLEHTAKSLKASGFTDIFFLGDSGGNQGGMRAVATKLNEEWAGTPARAHFIGDYYTKSNTDTNRHITEVFGIPSSDIGSHAGINDTSQLMYVAAQHVRNDKRAPNGGSADSGVSGDPTKATAAIGEALIKIKIDNAVAQMRASMAARRTP